MRPGAGAPRRATELASRLAYPPGRHRPSHRRGRHQKVGQPLWPPPAIPKLSARVLPGRQPGPWPSGPGPDPGRPLCGPLLLAPGPGAPSRQPKLSARPLSCLPSPQAVHMSCFVNGPGAGPGPSLALPFAPTRTLVANPSCCPHCLCPVFRP